MEHETTGTALRKSFPDRACAYEPCSRMFTPRVEWQRHCSDSHRALAYQARKLKKAVEREVRKRLRQMRGNHAH